MTTTLPPRQAGAPQVDQVPASTGAAAPAEALGSGRAERPAGLPPNRRRFAVRVVRGAPDEPAWARPALLALVLVAAGLYLWNLSASGYANSFYAAPAQAGSVSWKAWFFGAFDSSSFITVDKPPASTWVMGLSGRIFGFSSWSVLVPQALEGVATVALMHAAVKRWSGPTAGLLAGAIVMLTPAAALMFRFNNPDALLVLLLVAATYCTVRALENAGTTWLMLAGTLVGFAFLTKMMQAFLVLPALALVYLICAPTPLRRRLVQLIGSLVAVIVSAGWWVAVVELVPASSRPYIGGSSHNSILELVLGYNGLGRIFGGQGNGGGGGGGGFGGGGGNSSFGGATGLGRLFSAEMANEISWLVPAALIALVAGLIATRSAPRTDRVRAALLLWGGTLIVTGLTFSYMQGTIHPYYTVALAPSIGALVAVGGHVLWQRRAHPAARAGLAAMILATGLWSYVLLNRDAGWHPELRYAVLAVAVITALALLIPIRSAGRSALRWFAAITLAGVLAGIAGTGAYAVTTAGTAHSGSIPSVGPAGAPSSFAGPGGGGGGGFGRGGFGGGNAAGTPPNGTQPGSQTGTQSGGGSGRGGFGGGGTSTSSALTALLQKAGTRWAAATVGSGTAASLQLASEKPVMSIGGFNGGDPTPTLSQFEAYVTAGDIGYFVAGGGGGGGPGGGNSEITSWVEAHYTATTVGGQTVYDLRG